MVNGLIKVDGEVAKRIISEKEPRGKFFYKHRNVFVGIDNSTGAAWVEEFTNLRSCKNWLRGGMVANVQGHIV
ncbi:MAG TPA: hypothetical protein VFD33_02420 [Bacillota bacterium]|nr:hypothetical protein [Bacillota bacterium]